MNGKSLRKAWVFWLNWPNRIVVNGKTKVLDINVEDGELDTLSRVTRYDMEG